MTPSAQLSFMNNYDLEAFPMESASPSVAYDAGVLEIKIENSAFTDILQAESFVTGGYTWVPRDDNPLEGRSGWSGNSGGFIPGRQSPGGGCRS